MIGTQDINLDVVIGEVRQAFERYEAALIAHDLATLGGFFLQRSDTVRFGLAEHNYGAAAIADWRRGATPVHPSRRLLRVIITSFGADCASVSAEFESAESRQRGRQSQLWVRGAEGWKIAAAHVSAIDPEQLALK